MCIAEVVFVARRAGWHCDRDSCAATIIAIETTQRDRIVALASRTGVEVAVALTDVLAAIMAEATTVPELSSRPHTCLYVGP